MRFADRLQNYLSGMGTSRDKSSANVRVATALTPQQILEAYRDSSIAARIIDLPAQDSVREWREWQASGDDISLIEAEEKRLQLSLRYFEAIQLARLCGGSALYISTGEQGIERPLDPSKIAKGGIKFISLFDRYALSGEGIVNDPDSEYHRRHEFYKFNSSKRDSIRVHASRLVIFDGKTIPSFGNSLVSVDGWGDSELNSLITEINAVDSTLANLVAMVFEGKIDILKVPELMDHMLAPDHANYTRALQERLETFSLSKGIHGMGVIDGDEEFDSKSISFSGVKDVGVLVMQFLAGCAGIPMTKLFEMSPAGMNATGEYDDKNYNDSIKIFQTLKLQPRCHILDECLIRSATGTRDEDIHYNWRPLDAPSPKEIAEIGDKVISALDKVSKMKLLPDEVVAETLITTSAELKILPGLEAAMNKYFDENSLDGDYAAMLENEAPDPAEAGALLPEGEAGAAVPPAAAPADPRRPQLRAAKDMAPTPLYVRRDVLNGEEILSHYRAQGIKDLYAPESMHVTIIYSKAPVDWIKMGEAWNWDHENGNMTVKPGGPRVMEIFGERRDVLVLQFANSALQYRNMEMRDRGASSDFEDYLPHISISLSPDNATLDPMSIKPYRGAIELGPEIFEKIASGDWREKVIKE